MSAGLGRWGEGGGGGGEGIRTRLIFCGAELIFITVSQSKKKPPSP